MHPHFPVDLHEESSGFVLWRALALARRVWSDMYLSGQVDLKGPAEVRESMLRQRGSYCTIEESTRTDAAEDCTRLL